MSAAELELAAQREANTSAIAHYDAFREHRERLTACASRVAPRGGAGRLCVLGAGNCYDLDLEVLAHCYREVHLVDVDDAALDRAWERQPATTRERLFRHAPVDVSGTIDRLDRWKRGEVTPEELMEHAEHTSRALVERLGAPFDATLSACLLTQIQLAALNVLGDSHALFEAVRFTLALTHLRALARLTVPGGSAVLATDLSSSRIFPLKALFKSARRQNLLDQLIDAGRVFHVANPRWLTAMAAQDPVLRRQLSWGAPDEPWLWQNGPSELFLVYTLELRRSGG